MSWTKIKVASGSKLFKTHQFNFLHKGHNFLFSIDEYADGLFTGHGQHATDQNYMLESVSGSSIEGCLEKLVRVVEKRET